MFTGIIEEIGTIRRIEYGAKSCVLTISANKVLSDVRIGDSIAVNKHQFFYVSHISVQIPGKFL